MIRKKKTVLLSATASSHATAATPPASTPPRSAPLTVLAARCLRLGLALEGMSRSAAVLMVPRYRAPRQLRLWLTPVLRGHGHPRLLLARELRRALGGHLDVDRVGEV